MEQRKEKLIKNLRRFKGMKGTLIDHPGIWAIYGIPSKVVKSWEADGRLRRRGMVRLMARRYTPYFDWEEVRELVLEFASQTLSQGELALVGD